MAEDQELFDHQVTGWTAGRLRKALEGVPDDFPVTVVTADDEPGSDLAGPEQVVVSAGPWNGQGREAGPHDRFEIGLEWPPGRYRAPHAAARRRNQAAGFTAEITQRARWARDHGGQPEPAWSTGERLAVALVLGSHDILAGEDFTVDQATRRLAGDLDYYGLGDPGPWLDGIRAVLRRQ